MPRGEVAGASRAEAATPSPPGRRLIPFARRYYPLGIAGAFLGTLVGFFPSTIPLGVGGSLLAGGGWGTSPSPAATGRAGPAPSASPPGFVAGSDTGASGVAGAAGAYGADTSAASSPSGGPAGTPPRPPSPSGTCPVPLPANGSPLASLLGEVETLCRTLAGSRSASAPLPSLFGIPGAGPSEATVAGSTPAAPAAWVALDVPASGAAALAAGAPATLAAARATAVLGLVEGAAVPGPFDPAARVLRRDGATVVALLVPDPGAPGGAGAFAAWVSRTVAALPDATLVAVGVGAPHPSPASSAPGADALAADALGGLGAAEEAAAPAQRAGLWWGDGGLTTADAAVWGALAPSPGSVPPVLRASAFVGATLGAPGTSATSLCAAVDEVDALRAEDSSVLASDAPPVVAELAVGPVPSPGVPSGVGTPRSAGGCGAFAPGGPALAAVVWRLGAGPLGFAVGPGS